MTTQEPSPPSTTIDAVWLGGPPGDRGSNIRTKLEKYGINFVAIYREGLSNRDRFPASTRVVLLNVDMASHAMQELGKRECARVGATFVLAGFDLARTLRNLQQLRLLPAPAPEPPAPAPEPPAPEPPASTARPSLLALKKLAAKQAQERRLLEASPASPPIDEPAADEPAADEPAADEPKEKPMSSPLKSGTTPTPAPDHDHVSVEAQAADALLSIERWPALRPFLLRGIVEALSKEAGVAASDR